VKAGRLLGATLVGAAALLAALPASAQTPPLPLPVPIPDSLRAPAPGAEPIPEGAEPVADADEVATDSVRQVLPRNVPMGRIPHPSGVTQGSWEWDRTALLNQPFLTLHDLLSLVPGVTLVRGGDIGSPVAVSWGGMGGGQVRVFLDGVEDAPLEGGVVDLAQVGLTGLESVRIERGPAELRIHLVSHQLADGQPLTVLEVGTGDFRTNLFRAAFIHPDALGGTVLLALDRFDSDGPSREEPGALYGSRFRYSLFPREGLGLALEYRSRTARRPEGIFEPREVKRSELSARLGWEVTGSLTAELHAVRASASLGDRSDPEADSLLPEDPRTTLGGRLTWAGGSEGRSVAAWVGGGVQQGLGWPSSQLEAGLTMAHGSLGGVSASWSREGWSELARTGRESEVERQEADAGGWWVRGWTAPRAGISLFAEAQEARRGVPFAVPAPPDSVPADTTNGGGDPTDPSDPSDPDDPGEPGEIPPTPFDPVAIFERSGLRAGVQAAWRGADVSVAWVRAEAPALPAFGLPFDRGLAPAEGGTRTGIEVQGRLPLNFVLNGLAVQGTGHFWEEGPAWRYLPERGWTGQVSWYRSGYDGDFEAWVDVGVRGRDRMATGLPGAGGEFETAPYLQSWFGRLQFRVATVRVFVQWENLAFKDDNADLPGRFQPQTRAMYGVRWTMWN
jgi:hypothetical protein